MLKLGTKKSFDEPSLQRIAAAARDVVWSEEAVLRLVERGRSPQASWRERCLAAFLLEIQIEAVPAQDPTAQDPAAPDFLFHLLNADSENPDLERELRLQGYQGCGADQWFRQLRQRLSCRRRLRQALRQDPEDATALAQVQALVESEWRLLLARYLLTPAEVVGRVRQLTRTSCGLLDPDVGEHRFFADESRRALEELPAYESSIALELMNGGEIWWVDDATPSQLGSLVEYPLGSIVLIVRPPGSDCEFELKRAGRRGPNPLRVFFRRQGCRLPKAHRLDCGSPSRNLRFEAGACTSFARLFRISQGPPAPGRPAPLGSPLSLRSVHSVPGPQGKDVLLLAYLSNPAAYGDEFPRLHSELEDVLDAYQEEDEWEPPPLGGDIGRATLFLTRAAPGQMLLAGTSAFRLDRLLLYLAPDGYQEYQRQLGRPHPGGLKGFQDLLLEVILGTWHEPPRVLSGEKRLEVILNANRAQAEALYLDLMGQAAQVWGTLLAVRGYASGESFVARNVGLRGYWAGGQRRLQLVFLDHDNLHLPPPDQEDFSPRKVLRNAYLDWRAILGGPLGGNNWLPESRQALQRLIGIKGHLKRIYGIHPETEAKGDEAFDRALSESYRRTQRRVRQDTALADMFHPSFRRRLRQWDRTAHEYLAAEENQSALKEWETRTRKRLRQEGMEEESIEEYVERPAASIALVRRFAFLWEP